MSFTGNTCKVLQTTTWRLPVVVAANLGDEYVPGPGHSRARGPGEAEGVAGVPGLQHHVEAGVRAADDRRSRTVRTRLELRCLALRPTIGTVVTRVAGARLADVESVKVEPGREQEA